MMAIDVNAAERALEQMTVPQLRLRYAKVYGEETRTHHKVLLIKRILWRMQALREGDLTERARQRASELANDADLRRSPPRVPTPEGPTPRANGESGSQRQGRFSAANTRAAWCSSAFCPRGSSTTARSTGRSAPSRPR